VIPPLTALDPSTCRGLRGVLCDLDDTLTWHGKLVPEAFLALRALQGAGLKVVVVTGRPGGWVDAIARLWPVDGVVGENGGLWFHLDEHGRMVRRFAQDPTTRAANRARLDALAGRILAAVPGTALASDQPYRDLDLAIDFCEDVPELDAASVDAIVAQFTAAGARSKVSSIHVNGWYGDFDKLTGVGRFVAERWAVDLTTERDRWLYVGDSPNDEPMFQAFPVSVGVANVTRFLGRMASHPAFLTAGVGGEGFAELAHHLLAGRR
jgi:HAD superfamily hydrolase (TIGR01484 family)